MMGLGIIEFYRNKIQKEWKIGFFATIIFGLVAHIYKIVNYLPNHDSVYNFYSDQNMIGSGRWFLTVVCGFSSYFDLPWITGLFSILFIALTVVVLIQLFEIKNPVLILITAAVTVTFPAITETMFFGFTADGYMVAMLFSAVAVYLSRFGRNKWYNYVIPAILICLACGIYQAYVSYGLVLSLCYFMLQLLSSNDKKFAGGDVDCPTNHYLYCGPFNVFCGMENSTCCTGCVYK